MTSTIVSRFLRLRAVFGVAFAMILAGILPGEEPRTKQPAKTKSKDRKAAERMAEIIRGAAGKAESRLFEGRDHFHANHLLGAPGDATGKALVDFIRKVCKD